MFYGEYKKGMRIGKSEVSSKVIVGFYPWRESGGGEVKVLFTSNNVI